MPQELDRAGQFRCLGGAQKWLEDSKTSKSLSLMFAFQISQWWNPETSAWEDWTGYEVVTIGRQVLLKADGSRFEAGFQRLRDVLGWDGDPESLDSENWRTPPCSIEVANETYKGQTRPKVQWINAYDYVKGASNTPGTSSASGKSRLINEHGSALRATFGGRPATAPLPPPPASPPRLAPPPVAASPTYPPVGGQAAPAPSNGQVPPPPPAPVPPPPSAPPVETATEATAWNDCCAAGQQKGQDPSVVGQVWRERMGILFGDRPSTQFTGPEWHQLRVAVIASIPPF